MRRSPIEIPPFYIAVIICTAEGWTWPLKAAACMIPVSLLIGSQTVFSCPPAWGRRK
jgi:hypothetical protein